MRFFADRMLGKLARKLRLLGFDVLYESDIDESRILLLSRDRILLTRDKILYRRAKKLGLEAFYIKSDGWRSQLRAVAKVYPIVSEAKPFTRCSICNVELVKVDRESVLGKVPEYVYKSVSEFRKCPKCGRIYWRGTHVDFALEELRKLVGL